MNAKWDSYGVRALMGHGKKETIPVKATESGSLYVTESGELAAVVTLELSQDRWKELIYEGQFSELSFAVVDGSVKVNLVDGENDSLYMSITGKTSISVEGSRVWLSNKAASGTLEVWIWR